MPKKSERKKRPPMVGTNIFSDYGNVNDLDIFQGNEDLDSGDLRNRLIRNRKSSHPRENPYPRGRQREADLKRANNFHNSDSSYLNPCPQGRQREDVFETANNFQNSNSLYMNQHENLYPEDCNAHLLPSDSPLHDTELLNGRMFSGKDDLSTTFREFQRTLPRDSDFVSQNSSPGAVDVFNGRAVAGLIVKCISSVYRERCLKTKEFTMDFSEKFVSAPIRPNLPLFFYDIERRRLYGIFMTTSYTNTVSNKRNTGIVERDYYHKVKFSRSRDYHPLVEGEIPEHIIELDGSGIVQLGSEQVSNLRCLFEVANSVSKQHISNDITVSSGYMGYMQALPIAVTEGRSVGQSSYSIADGRWVAPTQYFMNSGGNVIPPPQPLENLQRIPNGGIRHWPLGNSQNAIGNEIEQHLTPTRPTILPFYPPLENMHDTGVDVNLSPLTVKSSENTIDYSIADPLPLSNSAATGSFEANHDISKYIASCESLGNNLRIGRENKVENIPTTYSRGASVFERHVYKAENQNYSKADFVASTSMATQNSHQSIPLPKPATYGGQESANTIESIGFSLFPSMFIDNIKGPTSATTERLLAPDLLKDSAPDSYRRQAPLDNGNSYHGRGNSSLGVMTLPHSNEFVWYDMCKPLEPNISTVPHKIRVTVKNDVLSGDISKERVVKRIPEESTQESASCRHAAFAIQSNGPQEINASKSCGNNNMAKTNVNPNRHVPYSKSKRHRVIYLPKTSKVLKRNANLEVLKKDAKSETLPKGSEALESNIPEKSDVFLRLSGKSLPKDSIFIKDDQERKTEIISEQPALKGEKKPLNDLHNIEFTAGSLKMQYKRKPEATSENSKKLEDVAKQHARKNKDRHSSLMDIKDPEKATKRARANNHKVVATSKDIQKTESSISQIRDKINGSQSQQKIADCSETTSEKNADKTKSKPPGQAKSEPSECQAQPKRRRLNRPDFGFSRVNEVTKQKEPGSSSFTNGQETAIRVDNASNGAKEKGDNQVEELNGFKKDNTKENDAKGHDCILYNEKEHELFPVLQDNDCQNDNASAAPTEVNFVPCSRVCDEMGKDEDDCKEDDTICGSNNDCQNCNDSATEMEGNSVPCSRVCNELDKDEDDCKKDEAICGSSNDCQNGNASATPVEGNCVPCSSGCDEMGKDKDDCSGQSKPLPNTKEVCESTISESDCISMQIDSENDNHNDQPETLAGTTVIKKETTVSGDDDNRMEFEKENTHIEHEGAANEVIDSTKICDDGRNKMQIDGNMLQEDKENDNYIDRQEIVNGDMDSKTISGSEGSKMQSDKENAELKEQLETIPGTTKESRESELLPVDCNKMLVDKGNDNHIGNVEAVNEDMDCRTVCRNDSSKMQTKESAEPKEQSEIIPDSTKGSTVTALLHIDGNKMDVDKDNARHNSQEGSFWDCNKENDASSLVIDLNKKHFKDCKCDYGSKQISNSQANTLTKNCSITGIEDSSAHDYDHVKKAFDSNVGTDIREDDSRHQNNQLVAEEDSDSDYIAF